MPEIIVALDVPTVAEAQRLVEQVGARWYKVGLELAFADGAKEFCASLPNLFLDLKLADIPTTVERACRQIALTWKPDILSVREAVPRAIAGAAGTKTKIAHVTALTSDMPVVRLSKAPYIVCPPSLVWFYRKSSAKIIAPGIRLPSMPLDDHLAHTTDCPQADYLVIGRPITRAADPAAAYAKLCEIFAVTQG